MNYGLDIGPTAVRVARETPDGPVVDTEPPLVVACSSAGLEPHSSTPVSTVDVDGTTYAVGTDARTVAAETGREPQSLIVDGTLSSEPYVAPALEALVASLTGGGSDDGDGGNADADTATDDDADAGTATSTDADHSLCYTTPERRFGETGANEYGRIVESVASALDFEPIAVNKGFAVVYDQLADEKVTGLGICLEPQATSLSLAYYGVPVLSGSLEIGTEWIIDRAAEQSGADRASVAAALEEFKLDPETVSSEIDRALAAAVDELAGAVVDAIAEYGEESALNRGVPVPVAVGGEGVIDGIEHLLGARIDGAPLGLSIRGVRIADQAALSPARGALAAANDGVRSEETLVPSADPEAEDALLDGDELSFSEPASNAEDELTFTDSGLESFAEELGDIDLEAGDIPAGSSELRTLETRLEGIEAGLKAFDPDDIEANTERLTRAATQRTQLESAVESIKDSLEVTTAKVETLRETSATEREALEDRLEGVGTALERLEGDVDGLGTELEAVEQSSEAELTAVNAAVESVQTDLEEVQTGLEDVLTDLEDVQIDLEDVTKTTEGLRAEQESLESHVEATDETVTAVQTTVGELESTVTALEAHLEDQQTQLNTLADQLAGVPDDAGERLEQVEQVGASLRAEISELQGQVEAGLEPDSESETITALESKVSALESTVAELESEQAQESRDEPTAATEPSIDTAALETLRERVDAIAADDGNDIDLEAAVETLNADIETLRGRVDAVAGGDRDDRDLEAAVETLNTDLETLSGRVEEQLATSSDVQPQSQSQSQDQANEAISALETNLEQLEAGVGQLEAESQQVSERLAELDHDHDHDQSEQPAGGLLTPLLAGGSGAGIIAGGALVGTGAVMIGAGAIVLGVVLLILAVVLS